METTNLSSTAAVAANGEMSLESKLRQLFAQQKELREKLEATRAELDQVNAEVLRAQEEYCTTPERENEYCECLKKILGFDPRISLEEIEEAKQNQQSFEELIAELENMSE